MAIGLIVSRALRYENANTRVAEFYCGSQFHKLIVHRKGDEMRRSIIVACCALLTLGNAVWIVGAHAEIVNIVSDDNWKCHNSFVTDWETNGFDDSGWIDSWAPFGWPHEPYPSPPESIFPGTSAEHMWFYIPAHTESAVVPQQAWFRRTFDVELSTLQSAEAKMRVDDGFSFYVNGELVLEHTEYPWSTVHTVDIASYLEDGENLFAIHAWNVPTTDYRSVLFDAKVAVPEPASMIIGGVFGLTAFFVRRRLGRI